ncbi:MAG: dinitrogenase iron-molybdenum cofactor biosynthesis protein [Proteobacteria bacterium]|nr:dinitrogenase iron-molybdenum cofactor biosynthesis protein [Pseudomonadota bacterium]
MKIAVTSTGNNLSSDIDPRFGRAANFIMVDAETFEYEAVENTQGRNLPQGAGIQAGKTVVGHKVDVLITGNCGPKAFQVLNQAGIKIMIGAQGQVKDAVQAFKEGKLQSAEGPNVQGHWT